MAAVRAKYGAVLERASLRLQGRSAFRFSFVPWVGFECPKFPPVLAIWIISASVVFATFRFMSALQLSRGSPAFVSSPPLLRVQMGQSARAPQAQLIFPTNKSLEFVVASTGKYKTYGSRCANNAPQNVTKNVIADGFKYYLVAVIVNRIYQNDSFRMSSYDMKQWIEYMLYAGVEHIYWYDTAHDDNESQEAHLAKYVQLGLLTYHRFHHLFPGSLVHGYHFEQDHTYRHFLARYGKEATWVAELDADEYPFNVQDTSSCFLRRAMQEYDRESALISQVLVECMFFLGNAVQDSEDAWLIEKYQRRKNETEGKTSRPKPIFRSNLVEWILYENPHVMPMRAGFTVVAYPERLRLNHYWGPRGTDFGPDTPELLEIVRQDPSIQPIVNQIKAFTGLISRNTTLSLSPR